jgi:hypothetical protein
MLMEVVKPKPDISLAKKTGHFNLLPTVGGRKHLLAIVDSGDAHRSARHNVTPMFG